MIFFVPFFEIFIFKAVRGPTSEIASEYAETLFDGTRQNLSFMSFGDKKFTLDWSRNKTDEEKVSEGQEMHRFQQKVFDILNKHW